MGIFNKKYDYEKDELSCEFDLEQDRYSFFKNGEIVLENQINGKSKKFLKKKNDLTLEEKENAREVAKIIKDNEQDNIKRKIALDKRKEAGIDLKYDSFEVMSNTKPKFSKEVKDFLDSLTDCKKDAEYVLGIHRIGASEEHLDNIFKQGIIVQGHGQGAARGTPELKNTVGYYPTNAVIQKEVGLAYAYKDSRGSIVVKIPKEDIISKNIYVMDEGKRHMYLNPKYIVGYFPIEDDKTVSKIVTKDTLQQYKLQREKEAQQYISMGEKTINYSPQEK